MKWIWNKLKEFYNFCGKYDGYAHLIGGFILSIQMLVYVFIGTDVSLSVGVSLLTSSLLFFLKEYVDCIKINPTGWSWRDIFNGYLGWFVGTWVCSIIIVIIHYIQ